MHFEVLVEDASGAITLKFLLEKILESRGRGHSFRVLSYKGIGRLPRGLHGTTDPQKRILLDRLPRILRGYGRSLQGQNAGVIVAVDLDDRDCHQFKQELEEVLDCCNPRPITLFRIMIEESEAWLLGDREAVKNAYPAAKDKVLDDYVQDSVCGTWEKLADAVFPGGAAKLASLGWPHVGTAKCEWADRIGKLVDIHRNKSHSFQVFQRGIRQLAGLQETENGP